MLMPSSSMVGCECSELSPQTAPAIARVTLGTACVAPCAGLLTPGGGVLSQRQMLQQAQSRSTSTLLSAALDVRVGRAVLAGIDRRLAARRRKEISFGIVGGIRGHARADFKNEGVRSRAVLQAVTIGIARLEASTVARPQNFGTAIRHKRDLSCEHVDKLIRCRLPMPLARPGTRGQTKQIDTELS